MGSGDAIEGIVCEGVGVLGTADDIGLDLAQGDIGRVRRLGAPARP